MTRDYKAEVLQILTDAAGWIRIDAIHDAIRNASPLYQPWGHVSKALVELTKVSEVISLAPPLTVKLT